MKKTAISLVFSGLAGAVVLSALASDPPHWSSASTTTDCTSQCHLTHSAAGGNLTAAADNVNLCQSCHNSGGLASALPLSNADKAVPGTGGSSHSFDAPAVNPASGAGLPSDPDMYRLSHNYGDKVVCSTCHDQHAALLSKGGQPRTSPAQKITALGSTGAVTSGGTYSGANGAWYLVEIQTAGALGAARFRYSKDNGVSWMASNVPTAASIALDSGLSANFSAGNYAAGERWQFSGAFPFLRVAADSGDNSSGSKFCRDCHSAWTMDHTGARTYTGSYRSHPVGVPLNANGEGYDRVGGVLDGNGATQAVGDGNRNNDLRLDAGGNVQCLTCHAMHFAPSNTTAVIP